LLHISYIYLEIKNFTKAFEFGIKNLAFLENNKMNDIRKDTFFKVINDSLENLKDYNMIFYL